MSTATISPALSFLGDLKVWNGSASVDLAGSVCRCDTRCMPFAPLKNRIRRPNVSREAKTPKAAELADFHVDIHVVRLGRLNPEAQREIPGQFGVLGKSVGEREAVPADIGPVACMSFPGRRFRLQLRGYRIQIQGSVLRPRERKL